ncbi:MULTISPECIES: hypothetical protein [Pectobacterium]|uniref:hypothetical protein n=1 Tax=Pectobacterium TaxID=122277 RepID=UPI001BFF84A9|nr:MULTISPECIES: hypothetical protein [Pectobacterium]MBT9185353.1 hypothetical protein [Pectobacterium punjabense]MCE9732689.1 hypothetical protein [Pectobacterium sp. IFB5596]GKW10956.1 hypothetical protein PEC301899_12380 [Pectobacterium carotovorum subsp. carotovorum]
MYRSELHSILVQTLEKAKWTRSTRDEDNFRQVICSHLYEYISPNNTEIPSTRSGSGDIRVFGRKIELKYINADKRDKLDTILADLDCLIDSKIEFCIIAIRFTVEHKDNHLVRAVDLPLVSSTNAAVPIANHYPHNYYGPGIFLPACYIHEIRRIPIAEGGKSKKTNSYISVEHVHNIERSCFIQIGKNILHVDIIGSKEDGLLTFLYKRADKITITTLQDSKDIFIPYTPFPLKLASVERVNISTNSSLIGRKTSLIEENVSLFKI